VTAEELIRWDWIADHVDLIWQQGVQHVKLTSLALGIGMAIAFPLGVLCWRHRRLYGPVTAVAGLLYTIPALALIVTLLPIVGLNIWPVVIALASYTLLILIRNLVAGLDGVSDDVREAATGMGLTQRQRLWRVEVPLALPAILAGVRIAAVSTIGLVTIGGLIGRGGFGKLIFDGLQTLFTTEILLGATLSVVLALVTEALLLLLQRVLSPWARGATRAEETTGRAVT
jgi:osmoprotectant transport system permease protein